MQTHPKGLTKAMRQNYFLMRRDKGYLRTSIASTKTSCNRMLLPKCLFTILLSFCLSFLQTTECLPSKLGEVDVRIIGGSDASRGEIPFQASLRDATSGNAHFCGGVIYNQNWIITLASCVSGLSPQNVNVVSGDTDQTVAEGTEQTVRVQRIIVHEAYNAINLLNDIALLNVDTITEDGFSSRAPLPSQGQTLAGLCEISGWGSTDEDGDNVPVLQKATLPAVSDQDCRTIYGSSIFDSMMCAGDVANGGVDHCAGDGGGPLICEDTLAGIASWGFGCGRPGFPGVYTEISFYVNWLAANTS